MIKQSLLAAFATSLIIGGCATAHRGEQLPRVRGVEFSLDTTETPAPARGALKTFAGHVEFAAGRGRIDVAAPQRGPTLVVNGVTIAAPTAHAGDYYLFDSTGYVLVRPSTHTFVRFALDSVTFHHGTSRDPWDGFFEFRPLRTDTLTGEDSAREALHGAYAIRWHLDRRHARGPVSVLARGRMLLPDAPAGDASVVRWFGAAAALASMPDTAGALPRDSLQLTAVVVLRPPGQTGPPINLIVLHPLLNVVAVDVDPSRLRLPVGFREAPGEHGTETTGPHSAFDAARKWQTLPVAVSRASATGALSHGRRT